MSYGWCDYCRAWTYRDLWRGACGDCLWRWHHYPQTMPVPLQAYRAEMPVVCSRSACGGSSVCTVYGEGRHAAQAAERIALAVVAGRVSAAGARDDLHAALCQAEVERQAAALRAYRAGTPVWTWPATAPWAGF